MNKDQEILAISRLVFELTRLGDNRSDLDQLLAHLHDLLLQVGDIQVLPKSAILLCNPQGELIQVAQFGIPAPWENQVSPVSTPLPPHVPLVTGLHTAQALGLNLVDWPDDIPIALLPLLTDEQVLGITVIAVRPAWQPDPMELEFLADLAKALSVMVSRRMLNETLAVREVELEEARTDAIRRLGAASEYRDNETGMHVMRMTHFAVAIAKAMGLPLELRETLAICAPMHDVGKIGIADAILLKPGKLTPEEYVVMQGHATIGSQLLNGEDPLISAAREIAAYHHERWDGTGYPEGLAGQSIPLLARICAVADVFDALTSSRPYKQPWPVDIAIQWVEQQSGTHFDPTVVHGFAQALPDILRIRELYRDDIIDPNQTLVLPELPHRKATWIQWDEQLSVGIDVIDAHHHYLVDLTNDLFEVVARKLGTKEVARVLKALSLYAKIHFRAEERMMDFHGYREMSRQHHQHRKFEERLENFYAELHINPLTAPLDVLTYLRQWLIHHIRVEDAKLRSLVKPDR